MEPRSSLTRSRLAKRNGGRRVHIGGIWIPVFVMLLLALFTHQSALAPEYEQSDDKGPESSSLFILDFHMHDLFYGWVFTNQGILVTMDSGAHWELASGAEMEEARAWYAAKAGVDGQMADGLLLDKLVFTPEDRASALLSSKLGQVQFVTPHIAWAMYEGGIPGDSGHYLLVSTDGGATWQGEVTAEVAAAIQAERERLVAEREQKEAEAMARAEAQWLETSYYVDETLAGKVMGAAWSLIPGTAAPGDVLMVRSAEPGEVTWQGKTYTMQPFGVGFYTYLPVPIGLAKGEYAIGDQTLIVVEKKFDTQYLQVSEALNSIRQNTERIAADQKKIDKARSESAKSFLFDADSPFIQPIQGILTTPYGYTRYVNGKLDSSHRAIDLAAPEGTPVKASNDGIVVLADLLYLTGNSVYIDHGMDLFSQYIHMSELKVKAGDHVKKGDIIGLVGTTGFSTGPHLHFTFWAHNVPVNPNLFFDTTPFHWFEE